MIFDERLSRERSQILIRTVNAIRRFAIVELLKGNATEDMVLTRMKSKKYQLVLAPWYRYFMWNRVEGFLGAARSQGPTFCGYFADSLTSFELEEMECLGFQRSILLDLFHLKQNEAASLVKSLLFENSRSGIKTLLTPGTPIYYESWFSNQGLGTRLDQIAKLPSLDQMEWAKRKTAIRICIEAFWTLIYEEGPGKSDLANAMTEKRPKAYFQIAFDERCLLLRLCTLMPSWSHRDALLQFKSNSKNPTSAAQLMLRYADAVRVHPISDTGEIEITLFLFSSQPAELFPLDVHTVWVEPLNSTLIEEKPYMATSPNEPTLTPLPETGSHQASLTQRDETSKTRDRMLYEAALKIKDLRQSLSEKEETLKELRSGGVGPGTHHRLSPPDAEALLDTLTERFKESRESIASLEHAMNEALTKGATPLAIERLRARIVNQHEREGRWIKQIHKILTNFKQTENKAA